MFCAQIIPQLDIRHLLTHWDFFFFLIWITVTYYFVQAALDSVTPMLIYVFKQKLREKTCCEEQPQQPRKEPDRPETLLLYYLHVPTSYSISQRCVSDVPSEPSGSISNAG